MSYQATISRAFVCYGYNQIITSGGNEYSVRALMSILGSADQSNFFDGNEAVGLVKPAALLFVPGSDPFGSKLDNAVFESSFFSADQTTPARLFTVRKVEAVSIGGVVVVYICACD